MEFDKKQQASKARLESSIFTIIFLIFFCIFNSDKLVRAASLREQIQEDTNLSEGSYGGVIQYLRPSDQKTEEDENLILAESIETSIKILAENTAIPLYAISNASEEGLKVTFANLRVQKLVTHAKSSEQARKEVIEGIVPVIKNYAFNHNPTSISPSESYTLGWRSGYDSLLAILAAIDYPDILPAVIECFEIHQTEINNSVSKINPEYDKWIPVDYGHNNYFCIYIESALKHYMSDKNISLKIRNMIYDFNTSRRQVSDKSYNCGSFKVTFKDPDNHYTNPLVFALQFKEEMLNGVFWEGAIFKIKYSDLKDYVKYGDPLYGRTREMFDKQDLPELYELLKNDDYAPYWNNVSQVIGFLSDDPDSIPFLLDYFQRNDGAKNFSMFGKIWSLAWIGKIGGNQADSILKKAVTIEGARELAKNWIDEELWQDEFFKTNKDAIVPFIRNDALKGLVLSGKQENLDFVEKLFNEQMAISLQNKEASELIDALGDAMALKDYIAEHGIDGYFAILHSDEGKYIMPYVEKYSFWTRLEELEENSPEVSFNKKANDLKGYIKLGGVSYKYLRERYGKELLPVLYEMLKDDDYAPYWHSTAKVIAYISDDPDSVPVLLDYLQRDDGSKNFSINGKLWSLALIGKFGGEQVDSLLKKAITKEGAKELVKNWIDQELWQESMFKDDKGLVILFVQNNALMGLVFTGKQENLDFVEKLYNEQKENTIKNKAKTELMNSLTDAMVARDYIADKGIGDYFEKSTSDNGSILGSYYEKYSVSRILRGGIDFNRN